MIVVADPNRNSLWGRIFVEELAAAGLKAVCLAPGSRSTPLTVAFAKHPDITIYSHLDERSAAFFALGRARASGEPTALVCTSGTAAANFHPAVIEADRGRVPLLVLTADRPPELRDSGANQTIDQRGLYGVRVRWNVDLPEPACKERTVRSLRTTAARAFETAVADPAGPVHVNCPFAKPLEPTVVPGDVPDEFEETLAGGGREGAFVETATGRPEADAPTVDRIADALTAARRPLFVAGPADPADNWATELADLAAVLDTPILADPLSGVRFGPRKTSATVCGGYDAYLDRSASDGDDLDRSAGDGDDVDVWTPDEPAESQYVVPNPDVVVRFGASPTSKALRTYLAECAERQFLIDSAGGWREARFTATDLVRASPESLIAQLAAHFESGCTTDDPVRQHAASAWVDRWKRAERIHWERTESAVDPARLATDPFEGAILASVFETVDAGSTVFVSNSMPVRDCDRFCRPQEKPISVYANRGASGIDGILSTAFGAGSVTEGDVVCVTGDLAFYHDSNGLLALERCGVDATIVVVHNDGGGIFHALPIESFDPPFTDQFKTPHGLDFEPLADLYGLTYRRVELAKFDGTFRDTIQEDGSQILVVDTDASASHRRRDELASRVRSESTSESTSGTSRPDQ